MNNQWVAELAGKKIGFVGAGNMAQSLITGVIAQGVPGSTIVASDPSEDCLKRVAALGATVTSSNEEVISTSAVVLLAVKPQVMQQVVSGLGASFQSLTDSEKPLLISIAAGISCKMITEWLGASAAVVRCMPNTPALLSLGATGLFASTDVSQQQKLMASSLLRTVGISVWVEKEKEIDIVTALSGSGPAYFFYMLESMIEKAISLGLERGPATELALQTAMGAAKMASESDVDVVELRRRVTSPNGTTEAAIERFNADGLSEAIAAGMQSAFDRAATLENELG